LIVNQKTEEGRMGHIGKTGRCRELFITAETEEVDTKGKLWRRKNICHKGVQGPYMTLEPRSE
jgi:hypothetical protein